mmetsp:Transcript_1239/g.1385  ORF Transcript_1239/g.1385 Transcript_1239/m.1385 type:complete len:118 (-) Transcript_1239:883-1236(-)
MLWTCIQELLLLSLYIVISLYVIALITVTDCLYGSEEVHKEVQETVLLSATCIFSIFLSKGTHSFFFTIITTRRPLFIIAGGRDNINNKVRYNTIKTVAINSSRSFVSLSVISKLSD